MEASDPRYGCSCIDIFGFKRLFPEWAARSDIERSLGTQLWYWTDEKEPKPEPPVDPVWYTRPEHWP